MLKKNTLFISKGIKVVFFPERETDCSEHLLCVNYGSISLEQMYPVGASANYGSGKKASLMHLYILKAGSISCWESLVVVPFCILGSTKSYNLPKGVVFWHILDGFCHY